MPAASLFMLLASLPVAGTSATSASTTSTVPLRVAVAVAAPATEPRAASPATAPPSRPASGPGASPRADLSADHAETLVGGVWQCETVAGSTGTHIYTSEDDGSIGLQTVLHTGFRTFNIAETYRFDDARGVWTAVTVGGAYRGTAGPWTHPKWIFDGTAQSRGVGRPARMVYFDLGQQAFRRDFQAREGGAWRTYSAETCTRPSN